MGFRTLSFLLLLTVAGCVAPSAPEPAADRAIPVAPQAALAAVPETELQKRPEQSLPGTESRWAIIGRPTVTQLASGAELLECSVGDGERESSMQVVLFDSDRCDIRVIGQSNSWAGAGAIRGALRSVNAVAGVNGGFFTPDFEPMGLVIADGVAEGRFQRSGLIAGAVGSGTQGPILLWNAEFRGVEAFSQLLQAGPRLVNRGSPVAGLSEGKRATRTFVATDGGSRWAMGVVKSPSLRELAEILSSEQLLPGLRIWRALNLDGGRSSSLWVRRNDGEEMAWTGWSTVRNFLAIVPR